MLAAPDQPGDDLGHAALLALVRVGHQPLHVRPQQGEEGVVEIAKQPLTERVAPVNRSSRRVPPIQLVTRTNSHLEQAEPARAELVLALAVLQREKLHELVDEERVREVVKDDLLPL